jgi:hypothetical protein
MTLIRVYLLANTFVFRNEHFSLFSSWKRPFYKFGHGCNTNSRSLRMRLQKCSFFLIITWGFLTFSMMFFVILYREIFVIFLCPNVLLHKFFLFTRARGRILIQTYRYYVKATGNYTNKTWLKTSQGWNRVISCLHSKFLWFSFWGISELITIL